MSVSKDLDYIDRSSKLQEIIGATTGSRRVMGSSKSGFKANAARYGAEDYKNLGTRSLFSTEPKTEEKKKSASVMKILDSYQD